MTISLRWAAAAALLATAACHGGESATSAPWLTYPGVDGHAKYLPLAGTSHDPTTSLTVTCTGCHTDPATFRATPAIPINCTGSCHIQSVVAPLHTAVSSFTFGDQACLDCHRTGIAAPPDHDTRFFPRSPAHAGIRCGQCHTDLASPNDPHNFACASCHLAAAPPLPSPFPPHTTVGGAAILTVYVPPETLGTPLTLTSENCLRCHADSQVDRVADHSSTSDGAFDRTAHQQGGCTTCHNLMRTDKPFAASFGWSSGPSRSSPGCTNCH